METVLLGTASTLAGVIVAGWLAFARDKRAEERQIARDEAQREHEAEEHRFSARWDAYVGYAKVAQRMLVEVIYESDELANAQGLVNVVGPTEAVTAAREVFLTLDELVKERNKDGPIDHDSYSAKFDTAYDAIGKYNTVVRRLLKFDRS